MDDRFAMRRLGRKSGFRWLAALVSVGLLLSGLAKSSEPHPAAVAFGSLPAAWGARLSPDGKRIVYLSMHESDLPVALVYDIEEKKTNLILASKKDEFDVEECFWASNERLLCRFSSIFQYRWRSYGATRLVGVNADGSGMLILLEKRLSRDSGWTQFQDQIVDLLLEQPDEVLIALRDRDGLGLTNLNIETGAMIAKQSPRHDVRRWISDGKGELRIRMKVNSRRVRWEGRTAGNQEWHLLDERPLGDGSQEYWPIGFGEGANDLFFIKAHEGKQALWMEEIGGEAPDRLVFSHPEVDVSGFAKLNAGKNRRVVAVSYMTDRQHLHFFDEKWAKIHDRLAPLFPEQEFAVSDESWDERFYLISVGSDISPGKLFRFDARKNELLPLADQYPKLRGRSLAPMKSLKYPARDGTSVPAYLTAPIGRKEGPQPAVILPHGGPHSRDAWGYDWLVQYLAARGYLVLQMNYRGSSGYGDEWLGEGGYRDWRTTVNDITDGARYLVETGQADPERMCIVGWSYGGYAALLSGVEEPSLYRCVVSIAGIGDLKDLAQEEKRYLYSEVAAAAYGKDDRILKAGSPARRAKEMMAPTLLFHGDEDIHVRIKQSEKMNKALKKADKEVTFIEYEEVAHSLFRNAVRIDMLDRMGEFLDTHTQPLPAPSPQNE